MFSRADERKSDLRNTTVMEVIVAVIVVLLFVIHFKETKFKEQAAVYAAQVEQLKKELSAKKDELSDLKKINKAFEIRIEALNAQVERLMELLGGGGNGDVKKLLKRIEELELKNNLLVAQNERLKSQIKKMQADTDGQGGRDKPICSISVGEIPVIGTVLWQNNRFQFNTIGPDALSRILKKEVPGIAEFEKAGSMSRAEFRRWGAVIEKWRNSQDPQCIFYVNIKRNGMTLEDQDLIERYFYKWRVE